MKIYRYMTSTCFLPYQRLKGSLAFTFFLLPLQPPVPLLTAWLSTLFSSVRCFCIKSPEPMGAGFRSFRACHKRHLKGTSVFHSLAFFNWKGFLNYFWNHHRAQKQNSQFNHSNHWFCFVFFSPKGHPSSYILSPLLSFPSRTNLLCLPLPIPALPVQCWSCCSMKSRTEMRILKGFFLMIHISKTKLYSTLEFFFPVWGRKSSKCVNMNCLLVWSLFYLLICTQPLSLFWIIPLHYFFTI